MLGKAPKKTDCPWKKVSVIKIRESLGIFMLDDAVGVRVFSLEFCMKLYEFLWPV